jgi:hypothetical protein
VSDFFNLPQIKKNRPTLKDAETFRKEGSYGVSSEEYVTQEEREAFVQEFEENLLKLFREHLPRTRRLDLTILKCHLILEYALNKFIELRSHYVIDLSRERFNFAQKITLAHMMGVSCDPLLIPSIELLNNIRNGIAHTLKIDKSKIDKFININLDEEEQSQKYTDNERIKYIKNISKFLCYHLLGASYAKVDFEKINKELMANKKMKADEK